MNRKLLPLFSKKNASFVVNGCFSPVVRTSYNKTKNGDIMCMLEKKNVCMGMKIDVSFQQQQ